MRQVTQPMLLRAHDATGYRPLAGAISVPAEPAGLGQLPRHLLDPLRQRYVYVRQSNPVQPNPFAEFVAPPHAALLPYLGVSTDLEITEGVLFGWEAAVGRTAAASVLPCPAAPEVKGMSPYPSVGLLIGGIGYTVLWNVPADSAFNAELMGFVHDRPERPLRGRLAGVRQHATRFLAPEADGLSCTSMYFVWSGTASASGPVSLADVGTSAVSGPVWDARRHRGTVNVAFMDGHIESLRLTDVDALRNARLVE